MAGEWEEVMERPTGDLLFFHDGTNIQIEKAINEIKAMNKRLAYETMSNLLSYIRRAVEFYGFIILKEKNDICQGVT